MVGDFLGTARNLNCFSVAIDAVGVAMKRSQWKKYISITITVLAGDQLDRYLVYTDVYE